MLIEDVGASGAVAAIDFAPKMLAEAQKKYQWCATRPFHTLPIFGKPLKK